MEKTNTLSLMKKSNEPACISIFGSIYAHAKYFDRERADDFLIGCCNISCRFIKCDYGIARYIFSKAYTAITCDINSYQQYWYSINCYNQIPRSSQQELIDTLSTPHVIEK